MKTLLKPIAFVVISFLSPVAAKDEPQKIEGFEEGVRQAFADYKKGDHEAVTAKLRELLKLMEEKGAAKVGTVLPDAVEAWRGETLKKDDIAVLGGGVSLSRTYVSGVHRITAKVVKNSPLVTQLLPLLANEDLIRMANRKTHRIAGETAIMEGESKLQIVVDGRIYVELEGDKATGETALVAFARKLDLAALAKMK